MIINNELKRFFDYPKSSLSTYLSVGYASFCAYASANKFYEYSQMKENYLPGDSWFTALLNALKKTLIDPLYNAGVNEGIDLKQERMTQGVNYAILFMTALMAARIFRINQNKSILTQEIAKAKEDIKQKKITIEKNLENIAKLQEILEKYLKELEANPLAIPAENILSSKDIIPLNSSAAPAA